MLSCFRHHSFHDDEDWTGYYFYRNSCHVKSHLRNCDAWRSICISYALASHDY